MSALVISLDFELFWGMSDVRTVDNYGANVEGVWRALPRLLDLFRARDVHATWATVGMVMCADFREWNAIRPHLLPGYKNAHLSNYRMGKLAQAHPRLFFARDLVQRIAETPGQELATHTYSHFCCNEPGATPDQLAADLDCAIDLGRRLQLNFRSIVFPRNQILTPYLSVLAGRGITAYRGNADHWLYRSGHNPPGGWAGRALRMADSWLPVSRATHTPAATHDGLVNVPASAFLRPWHRRTAVIEPLKVARLTRAISDAARSNRDFHLWWHPHNFGVDTDRNLAVLSTILDHYRVMRDHHGMQTLTMSEVAAAASPVVPTTKKR